MSQTNTCQVMSSAASADDRPQLFLSSSSSFFFFSVRTEAQCVAPVGRRVSSPRNCGAGRPPSLPPPALRTPSATESKEVRGGRRRVASRAWFPAEDRVRTSEQRCARRSLTVRLSVRPRGVGHLPADDIISDTLLHWSCKRRSRGVSVT